MQESKNMNEVSMDAAQANKKPKERSTPRKVSKRDPEILAMEQINRILDKLNPPQKKRLLTYLNERCLEVPERKPEFNPASLINRGGMVSH